MIRPPRGSCAFIIRTACCAHRNAPVRLVSTARRQSSSEISSTAPAGPKIPALFTSRSTRPHRPRTVSNSAATEPASVTSVTTGRAACGGRCGEARRRDTASRSVSSRRPAAATRQPAPSSARVISRPSPDPAPVTTATPVVVTRLPPGSTGRAWSGPGSGSPACAGSARCRRTRPRSGSGSPGGRPARPGRRSGRGRCRGRARPGASRRPTARRTRVPAGSSPRAAHTGSSPAMASTIAASSGASRSWASNHWRSPDWSGPKTRSWTWMSSPTSASLVTGRSVTPAGQRDVRGHAGDLRDHHRLLVVGQRTRPPRGDHPGQGADRSRRASTRTAARAHRNTGPARRWPRRLRPGPARPDQVMPDQPRPPGATWRTTGPSASACAPGRVAAGAAADLPVEHGPQPGVIHPRRSPSRARAAQLVCGPSWHGLTWHGSPRHGSSWLGAIPDHLGWGDTRRRAGARLGCRWAGVAGWGCGACGQDRRSGRG